MRYFLFCSLLLASLQAYSQFGLSGAYLSAEPDEWSYDEGTSTINLPGSGWQLGVDYRFRLKSTRIEFLPTLAYSRRDEELNIATGTIDSRVQAVSLLFHTNFYLFDLQGDCDCPTFSKQGPALQKGFYLQVSPGVSYFDFQLARENDELTDDAVNFNIGLAVGLDIGVTDGVTLSPFIGGRYYPGLDWESLDSPAAETLGFPSVLEPQADVLEYQLGLRIGFHLN